MFLNIILKVYYILDVVFNRKLVVTHMQWRLML